MARIVLGLAVAILALGVWTRECDGATASGDAIVLWEGFRYEWLNAVLGIAETPHRVGTLASYVFNVSSDDGGKVFADSQFHFTPGVDGDFSTPQMGVGAYALPEGFAAATDSFFFEWVDNTTGSSDAPIASHTVRSTETVHLPTVLGVETWKRIRGAAMDVGDEVVADLALSGFEIGLNCDNDIQPAGHVCNSDGMWPAEVTLDVDTCAVSGDNLVCDVVATIDRAWTPFKGGGKPFNYVMNVNVTLYYTVAAGPSASFAVTDPGTAVLNSTTWSKDETNTMTIKGAPNMTTGIVGVRGFGFTMLETLDQKRLGRYCETIGFGVQNVTYTPSAGTADLILIDVYHSPVTTVISEIEYRVHPVLWQWADAVASARQTVTGEVCENARNLYTCTSKGLVPRLTDTVAFNVTLA